MEIKNKINDLKLLNGKQKIKMEFHSGVSGDSVRIIFDKSTKILRQDGCIKLIYTCE